MSPRSSTLLALAGVLLAGIPLPALTGARPMAHTATPAAQEESPASLSTYASLQFSGRPVQLIIRHDGHELARLPEAEAATGIWETELRLPATDTITLEIEATWPEGTPAQAVTLTLEPARRPQRQHTQWTAPGSPTLHSLFSYSW